MYEDEAQMRVDEILSTRAKKLVAERGVTYEEASRRILDEDPRLAEAYKNSLLIQD